jgi:hypothetical protein
MHLRLTALTLLLVACGGCGDDGNTGPVDAPITVDIDNGSCGDQLRFTGEYIDWDSSDAAFCGIFDALFEVQGGNGSMDNTAPNGRFDQCVSGTDAVTLLDITPSADPSQCTTPASTYPLAGVAVANAAMVRAGGAWSGRNFTADRQASLGVTLDPAKAHVFVHVDGPARTVALAAAHGDAQTFSGTTWGPGDTGTEVFFPNVDVGTTALSATGGSTVGTGEIPLEANKVTNVTLKAF